MKRLLHSALAAFSLFAASGSALAAGDCSCDAKCVQECQKGKSDKCECKNCGCSKGEKCTHGKCGDHKK